jgi:hypothetical protein
MGNQGKRIFMIATEKEKKLNIEGWMVEDNHWK